MKRNPKLRISRRGGRLSPPSIWQRIEEFDDVIEAESVNDAIVIAFDASMTEAVPAYFVIDDDSDTPLVFRLYVADWYVGDSGDRHHLSELWLDAESYDVFVPRDTDRFYQLLKAGKDPVQPYASTKDQSVAAVRSVQAALENRKSKISFVRLNGLSTNVIVGVNASADGKMSRR